MVAVDPATRLNGCLEIAAGRFGPIGVEESQSEEEKEQGLAPLQSVRLMPTGCLCAEDEDRLAFQHVECAAGDVLIFSGYVPHRSASNRSGESRRAVFFTYNPSSQGDHHDTYYAAKHAG
jgi:ectoine hydroxylase-related dioxygenase (phytanoyl-CoA dioxygenase family)